MLFRASGLIIVLFWVSAMSWLIWHDVWPTLSAGEPPEIGPPSWPDSGPTTFQVGIFNKYDQRIGSAWTTYKPGGPVAGRRHLPQVGTAAGDAADHHRFDVSQGRSTRRIQTVCLRIGPALRAGRRPGAHRDQGGTFRLRVRLYRVGRRNQRRQRDVQDQRC